MSVRKLAFGLSVLCATASVAVASEDDHMIKPDNVIITLSDMAPNADGLGALEQPSKIKNLLNVSIILRRTTARGVEGKLMKKTSVFGNSIWREIDFLNVRPSQTMVLGDDIKLVFPADAQGANIVTFYFGPKGTLSIER